MGSLPAGWDIGPSHSSNWSAPTHCMKGRAGIRNLGWMKFEDLLDSKRWHLHNSSQSISVSEFQSIQVVETGSSATHHE